MGQGHVTTWALAGEVESAIEAGERVWIDFGLAARAGQVGDRQRRAASKAHTFVLENAGVTLGADELSAVGAGARSRVEPALAIGAIDRVVDEKFRKIYLAERRSSVSRFFGGQPVVTMGADDGGMEDRLLAMRAGSGEKPIAAGADGRGRQEFYRAIGAIEIERQAAVFADAIVLFGGGSAAWAKRQTARAANAVGQSDRRAAVRAVILIGSRGCIENRRAAEGEAGVFAIG